MKYAIPARPGSARTGAPGKTALWIAMLCCVLAGGCGKTVITRPVTTPAPAPAVRPAESRISVPEAENALRNGNMVLAERIATQIVTRQETLRGLSNDDTARIYRVQALAAAGNGHPFLAMTALDRWLAAAPGADASDEWRETFLVSLGQLPLYDAQSRAAMAMTDPAKPFPLRSGAALFLAARQWDKGEAAPALANLETFYAHAGDKTNQAHMEHALFAGLQSANSMTLASLDAQVTAENAKTYPYAVVRLEALRRQALHGATLDEAREAAAFLAEDTMLADPSILGAWDAQSLAQASVVPLAGKKIVLALPLGGQLGGIGKKIALGADEARNEFARSGYTVSVITLDTNSPDWMDRLAALPPDATIVGGPLRLDMFAAANAHGLTRQRAFFTFLPGLGDGREGLDGWRFFPSNEDQLTALFAVTSRLGITSYAVLMPDNDPYAARMADMFAAHAAAMGGSVVRRAEYPRNDPSKWNKFIGSFLGTHKKATGKPATPHQAVFLPDSWRNMELIVPNLFYFLETRQVLLGTSLWEQGLAATDKVAAHYYRLAVFPGAWNKTAPSRAAEQLFAAYARAGRGEPDFWAGLGYDFVRFAATLDVPVNWNPEVVNMALARGTDMLWSMAPITWSHAGAASQNLFLFTPREDGFAPADLDAIEATFRKEWHY